MHLNARFLKLEELKNYINDAELRGNEVLKNLNWSKRSTLKEFNSNFRDENSIQYAEDSKDDPKYPETLKQKHNYTLDESDFVKIFAKSDNTQGNLDIVKLPNKFSDMQVLFDREQKLKVYNYVIEKLGKITEVEFGYLVTEKESSTSNNKFMTFAEIVALRRNLKRRRLKYRIGKDPPLSISEELRNLIEIQMIAFEQFNNQSTTNGKKEENESKEFTIKKFIEESKSNYQVQNCGKNTIQKDKTHEDHNSHESVYNRDKNWRDKKCLKQNKNHRHKSSSYKRKKSQDRKSTSSIHKKKSKDNENKLKKKKKRKHRD